MGSQPRWPNQPVLVYKGSLVVGVLCWLGALTDEVAFSGMAVVMLIVQAACHVADSVDRRNARDGGRS